ncbi:MAG: hypothetical protein GY803_12095 [Chloroflexi bacterium]|nr:hypothetical protein [Chloroflexota bacterium]
MSKRIALIPGQLAPRWLTERGTSWRGEKLFYLAWMIAAPYPGFPLRRAANGNLRGESAIAEAHNNSQLTLQK